MVHLHLTALHVTKVCAVFQCSMIFLFYDLKEDACTCMYMVMEDVLACAFYVFCTISLLQTLYKMSIFTHNLSLFLRNFTGQETILTGVYLSVVRQQFSELLKDMWHLLHSRELPLHVKLSFQGNGVDSIRIYSQELWGATICMIWIHWKRPGANGRSTVDVFRMMPE